MAGRGRIVGLDGGERTSAAASEAQAQVKKKTQRWSMPQDQIDHILSWDVSDFVSTTLGRIDRLPSSDEKERRRAEELSNIDLMQGVRRRKREIQQFVRDELARKGYVVIEVDE
ncbi:hypothetical protein ACUV84_036454 [Puccinellia chinampoensis]